MENNFNPRRDFLKSSATIIGGALAGASLPIGAMARKKEEVIKIALVGCGDRGSGAVVNALSASPNLSLVAMADVFRDRLDTTYNRLTRVKTLKGTINVPEKNKFTGFDGYQKAIELADVVFLVTPATFRPLHFEAAVNAGKHVFMEKPLAVDSPGIRKVLATGKLADKKNLKVLVGLQNRYDPSFNQMVTRLKDGAIGDIVSMTDYYMIGQVRFVPRQPNQSELEFQMRNWRNFNWLWAGSPAGLQIHNTDIVNWVKGSYPVRAQGMGGKSSLTGQDYGDIFDHFFIEYEYADGTKLNSQIRTITGTYTKGGAFFQGAKGTGNVKEGIKDLSGNQLWKFKEDDEKDAYVEEHLRFFDAIRNDKPFNDTEWAANSTMTTILGRMAAHSGKMVQLEEAFNSDLRLAPEKMSWDTPPPAPRDKDGNYEVPNPGKSIVL